MKQMTAPTFSDFYSAYPRKMKPRDAEKAWGQALKRGVSPYQIMLSLEIMLSTEWKGRDKAHIPYPATFLRGGDADHVQVNRESYEERCEALEDECERPFGRHLCDACPVAHVWDESGPAYNMCGNWILACPSAKKAILGAIMKVSVCNG